MKGFLSVFIIFMFWASGVVYYLSIFGSSTVAKNKTSGITVDNIIFGMPSEINTTESGSNGLQNPALATSPDSLFERGSSSSNSQLLADELKMSITISDTIDINKGEPDIIFDEELLEENTSKNHVFYPRYTKSSELILDEELVVYAIQLKKLLKEFPNKKVTIVGHTDNVGNAKDNFTIALKKSRQIKWYLTSRKGIPRSYISATSKGERQPLESNSSKWGREQNNRIEIIVE